MRPVGPADGLRRLCFAVHGFLPQHFLNFLPEPQGHGSLRPTLFDARSCFGRAIALKQTGMNSVASSMMRVFVIQRETEQRLAVLVAAERQDRGPLMGDQAELAPRYGLQHFRSVPEHDPAGSSV